MAGVILAILLAGTAVAALVVRARRSGAGAPSWLDRAALAFGGLAVIALWLPMIESHLMAPGGSPGIFGWLFPASIAIGLVALGLGIWAVTSGVRSWRAWLGLGFGAVITGFWLVFLAGELLFPH